MPRKSRLGTKNPAAYNHPTYQANRAALLATATHCYWCGLPPTPSDPLTADHEPPLAQTNDPAGPLVAAHQSCNGRRGGHQSASDRRNTPLTFREKNAGN